MVRKCSILFFLLLPVFYQVCKGQEKRSPIDRPIGSLINLDTAGFLVMLGANELAYYEADGDMRWRNTITSEPLQFVVASPSGAYVYAIAPVSASASSLRKRHSILQFNASGEKKSYVLEPSDDHGKKAQSVFCDDTYLYYLATKSGDESNARKKREEQLILNRLRNTDLSYTRIVLDLPKIASGENSTYWSFIGQGSKEKFLVAKNIQPERGLTSLTIAAFDSAGRVVRTIPLEIKLPRKYIRPAYGRAYDMYEPRRSFLNFSNLEFTSSTTSYSPVGSSSGYSQGTTQAAGLLSNGAFAQVYFDERTENFYVYGLFGPKPYYSIGSVYEGFYVFKYNLQGKMVWELVETGGEDLLEESYFKVHAMPGHRTINLQEVSPDVLNFSISFAQTRYFYAIERGKVTATKKFQGAAVFGNTSDFVLLPSRSEAEAFLQKKGVLEKRNYKVKRVVNTTHEVVFIEHKDKNEVYSFVR